MARHDMLDDGEPESRALDLATAALVHAVEALAQPRQAAGRDALAIIADPHPGKTAPGQLPGFDNGDPVGVGPLPAAGAAGGVAVGGLADADANATAGSGVLDRIGDEVLHDLEHLIARRDHMETLVNALIVQSHFLLGGHGLQRFHHFTRDEGKVHDAVGHAVLVVLDARERLEIVDQATHTLGLAVHGAEETIPGVRVIACRAPHGLDVAGERGERRAQFMAGIGQKV